MKIITMYELLGMVKDGKAPKKIKVGNKIYNYETFNIGKGDNYFTAEWGEVKGYRINNDGTYYYLEIRDYDLNEEVEILEEEPYVEICGRWFTKSEYDEFVKDEEEKKIPEKIKIEQDTPNSNYYIRNEYGTKCALTKHSKMIIETLNEVIDYLKSKGDE